MLLIFEMANNHNGDLATAKRMVDEFAKVAKEFPQFTHAFKTQYRNLPTYIHPSANPNDKYVKRFKETDMPAESRRELVEYVMGKGFLAVCTPFDEASVDMAVDHGYDMLKVGSPSFTDWPLWSHIFERWHRPIIASVGGASETDIQKVGRMCDEHLLDLTLMHCVSDYPSKPEDLQLAQIWWLKEEYDFPVGYSSHEEPGGIGTMFAPLLGAEMIERHICLDPAPNRYSVTPDQMRTELLCIATAMKSYGQPGKRVPGTKPTQFMRQKLGGEMWWTPGPHFPMDEIMELVKKSGIVIPKGSEWRIYHHLGPERFADVGATIVTCFNRDYCKKYIVLLPGQTLPTHTHGAKEETFTLLWGDVRAAETALEVGQTLLVEPGSPHSLTTKGGAVLEEISTRYLPNDSVYADDSINNNPNRTTEI